LLKIIYCTLFQILFSLFLFINLSLKFNMKTITKLFLIFLSTLTISATFGQQNQKKKKEDGTIFDEKSVVPVAKISCPQGTTMTNGRCVPNELLNVKWLDFETGQIKYFEYSQDTPLDNTEILKKMGVEVCVILKGKYSVDRSGEGGGKITLRIQPIKWINRPPIPTQALTFDGTNPKGQDCKGFGNSCWFITKGSGGGNAQQYKLPFFITPIVTQEVCKTIEVNWRGDNPKAAGF
jgi:hypothetical protein